MGVCEIAGSQLEVFGIQNGVEPADDFTRVGRDRLNELTSLVTSLIPEVLLVNPGQRLNNVNIIHNLREAGDSDISTRRLDGLGLGARVEQHLSSVVAEPAHEG